MRSLKVWAAVLVLAVAPVASAADTAAMRARLQDQVERLAMQALPTNEFRQALGFFGPVTKKYLPVFRRFNTEYLTAKDKLPVVVKYLPQAEAAYGEAQAMKVPPKYEEKKQGYLKMVGRFLAAVRMAIALAQ